MITITTTLASGHGSGMITGNDENESTYYDDLWWHQDMVTITTTLASGHGSGMITCNDENDSNYDDVKTW